MKKSIRRTVAAAGAVGLLADPHRVDHMMNSRRARAVFGVCLAVAVALMIPAAAAAATPATLTGETLFVPGGSSAFCVQSGTVSFTASGTAIGPYSGTFTETGTATGVALSLTSFSASFTIYSSSHSVLVKGTTTASSGDWCSQPSGDTLFGSQDATYHATIFTANGDYSDYGASTLGAGIDPSGTALNFGQGFTSALSHPVLMQNDNSQGQNDNQGQNNNN